MTIKRYPGGSYFAPKPPIQLPRRGETVKRGGTIVLGPLQINWYGQGWRVYLTWPRQYVIAFN